MCFFKVLKHNGVLILEGELLYNDFSVVKPYSTAELYHDVPAEWCTRSPSEGSVNLP